MPRAPLRHNAGAAQILAAPKVGARFRAVQPVPDEVALRYENVCGNPHTHTHADHTLTSTLTRVTLALT